MIFIDIAMYVAQQFSDIAYAVQEIDELTFQSSEPFLSFNSATTLFLINGAIKISLEAEQTFSNV